MFLAPKFFFGGGTLPEFLEWDYKIQPDSDHVAKFQGDRSRDFGELMAKKKKKKTSAVKHKPVRNGGCGRPKYVGNSTLGWSSEFLVLVQAVTARWLQWRIYPQIEWLRKTNN